jgi:hypothetical protein
MAQRTQLTRVQEITHERSRRYCHPRQCPDSRRGVGAEGFPQVVSGVRIRQIEREEAEIAIEFLRDWGFIGRIVERAPDDEGPMAPLKRAA